MRSARAWRRSCAPAGFVFHIGNACEDRGVIRLDCIRSPSAWNAMTGLKEPMRGRYDPVEHPSVALLEIDLKSGRARQDLLPQVAQASMPRVMPLGLHGIFVPA